MNIYKQTKYKSKKIEYDGHKFDSIKEKKHYEELKKLEKQGKISSLELQPSFILQEKFKRDGKTYRPITYIADFKYFEDGKVIVEDVKSYFTAKNEVYKIKKKMLLYKYEDFEFREVI